MSETGQQKTDEGWPSLKETAERMAFIVFWWFFFVVLHSTIQSS